MVGLILVIRQSELPVWKPKDVYLAGDDQTLSQIPVIMVPLSSLPQKKETALETAARGQWTPRLLPSQNSILPLPLVSTSRPPPSLNSHPMAAHFMAKLLRRPLKHLRSLISLRVISTSNFSVSSFWKPWWGLDVDSALQYFFPVLSKCSFHQI